LSSWNPWDVKPGQVWVHDMHVLLVLKETSRERFDCLVLHDSEGVWLDGSVIGLTAYLVQAWSELL